jgi:peroxiredoxin
VTNCDRADHEGDGDQGQSAEKGHALPHGGRLPAGFRTEFPLPERGYNGCMADYPAHALEAGTQAPDFHLKATPDQWIGLDDFRGKALIMAFYPADWSPVCTDQMALYNEILPLFHEYGAEIVGVSVDSAWCHAAFAQHRNLHFSLLADFHPKGEAAKIYGVYDEQNGVSKRALFVLDGEGVIRWSYVSPMGVNPDAEGILATLEQMKEQQVGAPA